LSDVFIVYIVVLFFVSCILDDSLVNIYCTGNLVHSLLHLHIIYLRQRRRYMFLPVFVCLSVCLLARLLKNACMYLDEMLRVDRCRDMDELINFEPNRIIIRMPELYCFIRYPIGYGTLQPCLGCQRAALLCGILRRKHPWYTYWRHAARASHGFTRSSSVAKSLRDASCLSVVSFNICTAQFFITSYCGFRFTSA